MKVLQVALISGGLLLLKQAAERCKEFPVVLVLDGVRRKRFACLCMHQDFGSSTQNTQATSSHKNLTATA